MDLWLNQRAALLGAEYVERVREADDAVARGDHGDALVHVRKGLVLEEQLIAARRVDDGEPVKAYAHLERFGTLLAIHGEVEALERLVAVSAHNLELNRHDSTERMHAANERLLAEVALYDDIRREVAASPGAQQVGLAKHLGLDVPYLAELVRNLCDAAELVAAKIKGRVALWPADSPSAPPVEERRPTRPWLRHEYVFPRTLSADAWERLRERVEDDVTEARAALDRDPLAVTILDFVTQSGSAMLAETGGLPLVVDREDNVVGLGHLPLAEFTRAARAELRSQGVSRRPGSARHNWAVLAMRDPAGAAVFREVPHGMPGAVALTALTTPGRNLDPAGAFSGLHTWLPDATLTVPQWEAAETEEHRRGRDAVARLTATAPPFDAEVAIEVETRIALLTHAEGARVTLTGTDVSCEALTDERLQVWVLGPQRAELVAALQRNPAEWALAHLADYCLLAPDGSRLVPLTTAVPLKPHEAPGRRRRHTLTGVPARGSVTLRGPEGRATYDLADLVDQHLGEQA